MKQPEILRHQRVKRICADGRGRKGLVVSSIHIVEGTALVDVIPEGSSNGRPEPWRVADIKPLPQAQQLPALGGSFSPPKGYPMIPPRSRS